MKYQSGGAFRRALEDRLRAQSLKSGVALVRLRKMVAFDRFVARLMLAQPDAEPAMPPGFLFFVE